MPKLVPRFAQGLFWAGYKAIYLWYFSAQTNAAIPTLCTASVSGSVCQWSKEENAIIPGKTQERSLSEAKTKIHKLQSQSSVPSLCNSVHCLS